MEIKSQNYTETCQAEWLPQFAPSFYPPDHIYFQQEQSPYLDYLYHLAN